MLNLDTHMLVFALAGSLTAKENHLLGSTSWGVSAIVFWELAKLVQLGRLQMDLESPEVVRSLSSVHVWPIDSAVSIASTHLDFSADPADELIAATSVVHHVPLITRDRKIRRSKLVPLA